MKHSVAYFHDIESGPSPWAQEAAFTPRLILGVRTGDDVLETLVSHPELCKAVWQAMGIASTQCGYIAANNLLRRLRMGRTCLGCRRMQEAQLIFRLVSDSSN